MALTELTIRTRAALKEAAVPDLKERFWRRAGVWTLCLLLLLSAFSGAYAEESPADSPVESPDTVTEDDVELDTSFFPDVAIYAPTATPEPTPQVLTQKQLSSAEYIFGGGSEAVNAYNRQLMADIAASGDIFGYVKTKWPGAQGRRAPIWKDFSPVKPQYTPSMGMFTESTLDLVGQEWYRYGLVQQDLILEDWQMTLVSNGRYLTCEYENGCHRSPWISKSEMGLERIIFSRMVTPNAGYSIYYDATGQRLMTTVAWRDADYNIKWDWREAEGVNVLSMSWNETNLAMYMLFKADDGSMLNAVITDASVSENDAYGEMLRAYIEQKQ